VRGSFQETAPRKTAEHTVKHRDGSVCSVVANHRGGGERSVVITTLQIWPNQPKGVGKESLIFQNLSYLLGCVVIYINIHCEIMVKFGSVVTVPKFPL